MTSTYIKICGLSTQASVDCAVEQGANGIGFVFAESPRQVDLDVAIRLAEPVRDRVDCVAVFRHPAPNYCRTVIEEFRPSWVQTDHQDFPGLFPIPEGLPLPVYRSNEKDLEALVTQERADVVLVESGNSGAGELADWELAKNIAAKKNIILAGGLDPDNVVDALAHVSPWGVDVSSGVESTRGTKDEQKIERFIQAVRGFRQEGLV